MELDYDRLVALRKKSAAWRLLKADHAALMLSFFSKVFVEQECARLRVRSLSNVWMMSCSP